MKVFYSPSYAHAGFAFDTTRKGRSVAESLIEEPIAGIEVASPPPLTIEEAGRTHAPAYVRAIESGHPRQLAESQGFPWDIGLWLAVAASNGGMAAAAVAALQEGAAGALSTGLHHARYGAGHGFCTLNGLVIAARAAHAAGAGNVLILDLDAHCGGGTASMINAFDEPMWQLDVSTNRFDDYEPTDRCALQIVETAADYLAVVGAALERAAAEWPAFDLCLYNAGMDPFEGCDCGGLAGIDRTMLEERERMIFRWCRERRLPVAFSLAGGYLGPRLDRPCLVDLHRLTIGTAVAACFPAR
jgi:acetoin utilization deacetylase AcuC-like enzyme